MQDYVELFAGPGGGSLAAQRLGLQGVGIELDPYACQTRRAAGLATVEGDVLNHLANHGWNSNALMASPPCQSFSMAGNGSGRAEMDRIIAAIDNWTHRGEFSDPRTELVLTPLRWILSRASAEKHFEWIALEQVPQCLPIWQAYARLLDEIGYYTAAGYVHAEQFGVPQTRKRAVLIAHRRHPVALPEPTHSRYYSRTPWRLDEGVLPWVSMAEALGWGDSVSSVRTSYGAPKVDGRNGSHTIDPALRPSHTVTGKAKDFVVVSNYGTGGDPANRGMRTGDQPAATITSKFDRNKIRWLRSNYSAGSSHTGTAAERGRAYRSVDQPSSTITGRGGETWTEEDERDAPRRRLAVAEAGVLQSFPADYPWRGKLTAQSQQVGNAYPPLLAEAVLRAVLHY